MKRPGRWIGVPCTLGLALAMIIGATDSPPAWSQDKPAKQESKEKPAARKKARGRLPRYFAKVVTQKQREDIYEIQARFAARIDELQKQIDELIRQRDQEVEAVLSSDQLAEVRKLREEAKKRQAARRRKSSQTKQPQ